jgi:DNA-binding NarL/FixJ family response regulator
MIDRVSALIVGKPGTLRDSLAALLEAIPDMGTVSLADDGAQALATATRDQPALVLFDTSLPVGEVELVLQGIRRDWPHMRCIVLVDDEQQRQRVAAVGGKAVLKGFPAPQLAAAVEEAVLACRAGSGPQRRGGL